MSSIGRTDMSTEISRLQAGFPAPSECTRILLGVIMASRTDRDVQGSDAGYDPFSEPPCGPDKPASIASIAFRISARMSLSATC